MYPRGELDALAERKMILQARIAVRRWEVMEAAAELGHPIAMVDRGIETWRRISPFLKILAVPAGLMLAKFFRFRRAAAGGKRGILAMLLGALPAIFRGVAMVHRMRAAQAARRAAARPDNGAKEPSAAEEAG